jgi:IS30 family transposase
MGNYKRLTLRERIKISEQLACGKKKSQIACLLNRARSTVTRELKGWEENYDPLKAHEYASKLAGMRNETRKLEKNRRLKGYVMKKLILKQWSPEQIARRVQEEFPKDKTMRISHESIYTYIYLLPRGELRRKLIKGLRHGKKTRRRRKGKYDKRGKIKDMISIEERPAEVEDRSIAGHWEGDLLMGKGHQSALGTIVERKTRTLILVPLQGQDAFSVRQAFEKELSTLPGQVLRSLTYDRGKEMAEHKLFTENTRMRVYFCHPHSPWERGTNENTNGLLRQYFPKGTDFNKITRQEVKRVQDLMNDRPRKVLNWAKPHEVFKNEILSKSGPT